MKIIMTETYAVEADSVAEIEQTYADGEHFTAEFLSVEFTEEKEKKEMKNRTVELTLEEFAELMRMADAFQLLKTAAQADSYLSELERAVFGMYEDQVKETEEDNF